MSNLCQEITLPTKPLNHIDDPEGDGGEKQPVRLSNNEFVVKANAVKNLGGGSVRNGAKKLYALQRQWDNMATA